MFQYDDPVEYENNKVTQKSMFVCFIIISINTFNIKLARQHSYVYVEIKLEVEQFQLPFNIHPER